MTEATRTWKKPPLLEALMGVSYIPKTALTMAHLGEFWSLIKHEYPISNSAVLVPVATFQFPSQGVFDDIGLYEINVPLSRLQFTDPTGSKMCQLQNGWMLTNWILRSGEKYPGFEAQLQRFRALYDGFTRYQASLDIGALDLLGVEVTYVNSIVPSAIYRSPDDIHKVFPGLVPSFGTRLRTTTVASHLFFECRERPIELHVTLESQKMQKADKSEPPVLGVKLQLQTRAALPAQGSWADIQTAVEQNHRFVNESLNSWISDEARKEWEGS